MRSVPEFFSPLPPHHPVAGSKNSPFATVVRQLAQRLPEGPYALNLCTDRYRFLAGFLAVLARGQINLLPPSRTRQPTEEIARQYLGSYCLVDAATAEDPAIPQLPVGLPTTAVPMGLEGLLEGIPGTQPAAILFTSGSTGAPNPSLTPWGRFLGGALATYDTFGFHAGRHTLVATVPPQHMFGLEISILLPLVTGVALHPGLPFYPRDIAAALSSVAEGRVLVTTPLHLRYCAAAGLEWPRCDFVLSATAPLSRGLAAQCEALFQCPVMEIYGSTETGAIAARRTVDGDLWRFYDGISAVEQDGEFLVAGGHLERQIRLNDLLELAERGSFRLLGRTADLVNVAGKRGSLGDLNHRLNAIPGVLDGVFFQPDPREDDVGRLAALVVAPGLDKSRIFTALAESLDPVFLPRPLLFVDYLPRNTAGKLPRDALLALFRDLAGTL